MYDEGFPWIKFSILSVVGIFAMITFAPTTKWKILFAACVPIGVGFALAGKSINLHGGSR